MLMIQGLMLLDVEYCLPTRTAEYMEFKATLYTQPYIVFCCMNCKKTADADWQATAWLSPKYVTITIK